MLPDDPHAEQSDRPNDGGPPHVSPADPIAPQTHNAGGTYAEADFSPAAQRSSFHRDQLEPGPHKRVDTPEKGSGFEGAQNYEPPGGQGVGK